MNRYGFILLLTALHTPFCMAAADRELDLVPIRGGAFRMGSPEAPGPNTPHVVTVTNFLIGAHEVTVAEFTEFLNAAAVPDFSTCKHIRKANGHYAPRWFSERYPVSGVSQEEAQAYCRWLSEKTGHTIRLPTEAEWEYAARGGINGARYPWGWGTPDGKAHFKATSVSRTAHYPANPFQLYDMAGNVFEWCSDSNAPSATAPARGGSWAEKDPAMLTVFACPQFPRDYRDEDVGFRILMEAP